MRKAYINAISESTKTECLEWLVRLDNENDNLREEREKLVAALRLGRGAEDHLARQALLREIGEE